MAFIISRADPGGVPESRTENLRQIVRGGKQQIAKD